MKTRIDAKIINITLSNSMANFSSKKEATKACQVARAQMNVKQAI